MRKIVLLFLLFAIGTIAFSQEITVRFTGQLNNSEYCRLDSVKVTNLTRNWTQTVEYPDTIIVLGGTMDANMNIATIQGLGQNVPNPFNCETRVELSVSQQENVRMQLLDATGKLCAEYHSLLDAGVHNFDISASMPQTYMLNAMVGSRTYSIRMVNVGRGCGCSIKYAGISGGITAKLTSTNDFQIGDNMRYEGYTTIEEQVETSEAIEQMQAVNQYVTLNFTHYFRPIVETLSATDITSASATLHGNITNDGGTTIIARGFYYGTSAENLDHTVLVGIGTGEYSLELTGLVDGTTYYYCAFAQNNIGITTGNLMDFTTISIVPPTVETMSASDITRTSAIIKGNIISDGNSEIISRGFKYGTAVDNLENTVLVGMGIDEYTTSLTELTVATTYYYCAFASNNAETATGEVLNFTTEDISLPTILTLDASNVGVTLATLNARITDDGGSAITSCGFYYGLTPDNLEYQSVSDAVNNDFSKVVNVNMYTTYYCKAYATNAAGTAVGNLVTFTTLNNWVDLGLPSGTCWATCNVGANNPEEYGNYYAWGETNVKDAYNWSNYGWCNGTYNTLTKYNNNSSFGYNGFTDGLISLEISDDVATSNMGDEWRMPTSEEMNELLNNCTHEWTILNGVNGRLFTGPNGNSIFLPAAGYRIGDAAGITSSGYYWTSSLDAEHPYGALILCIGSDDNGVGFNARYNGMSVRPIRNQ